MADLDLSSALADVLPRLGLDLAVLALLVYGIYFRRHRRHDLVVVYAMFNLGLFLALVVITRGSVGLGVGLGLFALLSMVRLRSETYSNRELAYFFVALIVALISAVDMGSFALAVILALVALAAAWIVDHPRVSPPSRRTEITLELALSDHAELLRHLEERLTSRITAVHVLEIDYVRETTRAEVWCLP